MHVKSVDVKNFRLLADVSVDLEDTHTVIVGRNNSGKTSFAEVLRRFLGEGNTEFQLEDFSASCYDQFITAYQNFIGGADHAEVRRNIPAIELKIVFEYEKGTVDLGAVSKFVIDLDPKCNEAIVAVKYGLRDGKIAEFFEGLYEIFGDDAAQRKFFKVLRDRVPRLFGVSVWAEDPTRPENKKPLDMKALHAAVRVGFINAQRGLDDITSKEKDVLAKVLEKLFIIASSPGATDEESALAAALDTAIDEIQQKVEKDFGEKLKDLMPTLKSFGYPGLSREELETETRFDVSQLLSNYTKVKYTNYAVNRPETYNGLGARNLIFILFQIVNFQKQFKAEIDPPSLQIVLIEEPEAHLHPQMQEVFIKQLTKIFRDLNNDLGGPGAWPVQFVVSTHSAHIVNAAGFEFIRYFLAEAYCTTRRIWCAQVKNLRTGMTGVPEETRRFLRQYMTLTRCDLFFADAAILVEGFAERMMLPVIIEKVEAAHSVPHVLSSKYMTIMEVGGAYAHLFFPLLEFLDLQAVVITDIDAVEKVGGKACIVSDGMATSNACLKAWFSSSDALTPTHLLSAADDVKVRQRLRVAYQVPEVEGGACGRTFEDAFMLANREKFAIPDEPVREQELKTFTKVGALKKSDFALQYAVADKDWIAPRYIADALNWLANTSLVTEGEE